jgi:predicted RNA-binding protein with PIN domain
MAMPEPTLYLFDGYNLLHAGTFRDRDELVDTLASFVAGKGARGVVIFDGVGEERAVGPLQVRYTAHADDLLERLAAENRASERVCVVSSDHAIRWTSGQEVRKVASRVFLEELGPVRHVDHEQRGSGGRVGDLVDAETREKLERLRRGQ